MKAFFTTAITLCSVHVRLNNSFIHLKYMSVNEILSHKSLLFFLQKKEAAEISFMSYTAENAVQTEKICININNDIGT